MFSFIRNYRVGTRLTVAFGVLLLFAGALAGIGLYSMSVIKGNLDEIVQINDQKSYLLRDMMSINQEIAVAVRDAVLNDDIALARREAAVLKQLRDGYDAAIEKLQALPASPAGRPLREKAEQARASAHRINDEVLALGLANRNAEGQELLLRRSVPAMKAWHDALGENMALQKKLNAEAVTDAQDAYDSAWKLLLGLTALALALGAAMALAMARSIVQPLETAVTAARDVAHGRLDGVIRSEGRDEVSSLLGSMREMQSRLREFARAQQEMYEQHERGEIDHRMPAEAFGGEYRRMAEQTNGLVDSHIKGILHIIEVVAAYGRGDLSRDVDRMPGRKADAVAAVDTVKAGLQAVNAQVGALVAAAVAGDFGVRGDASAFTFVYRDLVEDLNRLMDTAERGLGELDDVLTAVADGDLTRRADATLPGRFGRLAGSANRTVTQLTRIVGEIRQGSDAIDSAAGEIAAGNNDLSQRTEQQAASLEETASSMEELTGTVRQNAENARQANRLAQGAADIATSGGGVVGQVVRTMGEIQESSRRIADIIGVIDGIAFQTNILALNAAVEAARAGEQGRGFAVVASEVRSLAQRSAGAAKEIKQLITDSSEKVQQGATLVDEAGRTMDGIVTSVKQVSEIIADISAASAEQSAGIEQVNQAIVSMDEGTQQNAALVEQASASARSLEQQAEQLVQAVAVFRLDAGAGVSADRVPPRPAAAPRPAPRAAAMPSAPRMRAVAHAAAAPAEAHWQEF